MLIVPVLFRQGPQETRAAPASSSCRWPSLVSAWRPRAHGAHGKPYSSYLWSIAALAPIAGLAVVDLGKCYPQVKWRIQSADEQRSLFGTAFCSAIYLVLFYGLLANWKGEGGATATQMFALGKSAMAHLLAFMSFFVLLNFCFVIASWFRVQTRAMFLLCHFLGGAMLWLAFRKLVFSALGFTGALSVIYPLCFAGALSAAVAGMSLQRYCLDPFEVPSGLALAFWVDRVAKPDGTRRRFRLGALAIVAVSIAAAALSFSTAKMDWNYLFQKLGGAGHLGGRLPRVLWAGIEGSDAG